jgi:tetratricopeptide (TPR) repeat protein
VAGVPGLPAEQAPDSPAAVYAKGQEQRELGLKEPADRRDAARGHFGEAAGHFAVAARGFADRTKPTSPRDLEWSACAHCARAEVFLRAGKAAEARDAMAAFLKDPLLARNAYRNLALYYHGFAAFLVNDYVAAGRSLNQLAPFREPVYGGHARYLLARVYQQNQEYAEAVVQYAGVLADYQNEKEQAVLALQQPERFKNDPGEKGRLEALRDGPLPEHVARAGFFLGVLHYEGGRFDEARARFADFLAQPAAAALREVAQLCLGCCQVRLNQCAEAAQTLRPVAEGKTTLAGQALLWLGKAQAGQANAADPEAYREALRQAQATMRRAVDAYQEAADSRGKARRGEALCELADAHQLAGQEGEAAALLGQILADHLLPRREEELLQRRLSALTRAGKYQESDLLCTQFQKAYPKSTLLPEVLFRHAENAGLQEAAGPRYQAVVERFRDFAHVNRARYGLALTHYRRGDYDKAREVLEVIPGPDRGGDLAVASYLLAECLLRLAPARADDALAAGRLEEQLKTATELLTGFANDPPEPPLAADALLRLGFCQQRQAALLANEEEKAKLRQTARATFERVLIDFPLHDAQPHAALERAKCLALTGALDPALRNLRRFTVEPLTRSPVAPLAVLQLATLLRGQENKTDEVIRLLTRCRQEHELALAKDSARAGWVPLLQYHHAVVLREAGRQPEARALFERILKEHPDRPVTAEAALRLGQCLYEEGWPKVEAARDRLMAQGLTPEDTATAHKAFAEATQAVDDAAKHLETWSERLRRQDQAAETAALMLEEAAWICRALGDAEVAAMRGRMQDALRQKLQVEAAKKTPQGQPVPQVAPPEVPPARVPLQPAEKRARQVYGRLLAAFPDLPLAHDARLELGELHAERGETDAALKVFTEALDKEPPTALADRVRVRLGACHVALGDGNAALQQFEIAARNPDAGLAAQGHLRGAECLLRAGRWADAVAHLAPFRDQEPFQNVGGLSDRALLQLGHALGRLGKWDESRQAYELLPTRFNESPWIDEARYGIGWTWFKQGQYAKAVAALSLVPAAKGTEPAARAQVLLGACRVEQRQFAEAAAGLEAVPGKYAVPELSALALAEAAHAQAQLKHADQVQKLLKQLVRDYPASGLAAVARDWLKGGPAGAAHAVPVGVRLLTPELRQPLPLEFLGQHQPNQASLDDPTTEVSLAFALDRTPPERPAPAPLLSLTAPDPFERQEAVRDLIPPVQEFLPPSCTPRPPQ